MKRAVLGVVAVVAGVGASAGAVLSLVDDERTRVGGNVFVNPGGAIDARNSPTVARNPRRPRNLVVAYRLDRPGFSAALEWSDDGGATWQPSILPLPETVPTCSGSIGADRCPFAPDVAFGPDGTLYVLYVNLEGRGNAPANLWLATSSDGGRSLSPPVRVAGGLTFQARLAVDPAGTVHVTWLQANEVGLLRLVGFPNHVVAARSTDGGKTFSSPIPVSDPHRERVGAASPVIDSEGELVVLYQDFKDDRRDFENLEGPPWTEPFALVVTRSSDGGKAFSRGVELESGVVPTRRFLVFLPEFPSLAAGPRGALYVAWADGRNGDEDVFLRRSSDGGRSWAPAVRVNDNRRKDGTTQYLPRVDVAEDGRVDVVFLDRRRDPDDVMTDGFLAFSHDGGRSFDNVRISSTAFDSRVGPSAGPQYGVDFGSRLGLASSSERPTAAAWTDTRLGSEASGRQDVVVAQVDVEGETPALARVPVVAGLLVLALAALLGWRRAGGRVAERNGGEAHSPRSHAGP
ncbi:MAG: glycoside hydrolase, partial [Actinomycetota bacterium]|nr:glycoside hydrolase [Actinomycetota bacterium]